MPRIPFKQAEFDTRTERISPEIAGSVFGEVSKAGDRVTQLAQYSARALDAIQNAQDNVVATKFKYGIDADFKTAIRDFAIRTDHENFDKDATNQIEGIRKKYAGLVGDNPRVQEEINLHLMKWSTDFTNSVMLKKTQEIIKEDQFLATKGADIAKEAYANAKTPEKRNNVVEGFTKEMEKKVQLGTIPREFAYELVKNLEKNGQQAAIINAIHSGSPERMREVMAGIDKGDYPKLSSTERETYKGTLQNNIEKVEKEIAKAKDDVVIDNAILDLKKNWGRDYSMMYRILADQESMKGYGLDVKTKKQAEDILKAEQALWEKENEDRYKDTERKMFLKTPIFSEIDEAVRKDLLDTGRAKSIKADILREDKIDPTEEAAEIVHFNNLISKGISPNVVRNSITYSTRMGRTNKEQYINKLESKLDQEIKDGRSEAYKDITSIIFPPSKGISFENLIQTPQQTMAILKSQTALDDWIKNQIKIDKYPTRNEIRKMGWKLATENIPSYKAKMEYMEKKMKEMME